MANKKSCENCNSMCYSSGVPFCKEKKVMLEGMGGIDFTPCEKWGEMEKKDIYANVKKAEGPCHICGAGNVEGEIFGVPVVHNSYKINEKIYCYNCYRKSWECVKLTCVDKYGHDEKKVKELYDYAIKNNIDVWKYLMGVLW